MIISFVRVDWTVLQHRFIPVHSQYWQYSCAVSSQSALAVGHHSNGATEMKTQRVSLLLTTKFSITSLSNLCHIYVWMVFSCQSNLTVGSLFPIQSWLYPRNSFVSAVVSCSQTEPHHYCIHCSATVDSLQHFKDTIPLWDN